MVVPTTFPAVFYIKPGDLSFTLDCKVVKAAGKAVAKDRLKQRNCKNKCA